MAIVGLALGLVVAARSSFSSTFTLQAVPRRAELSAVGIDPDQLDTDVILDVIQGSLVREDFDNTVSALIGATVAIESVRVVGSKVLTVTVSSDTAAAVDAGVTEVLKLSQAIYVKEASSSLGVVHQLFETRLKDANRHLASVETILQQATGDQQTLIEGMIVERQRATAEIDNATTVLRALDRYEQNVSNDLRDLGRVPAERSFGRVKLALAGAILGAILCSLAVLGRTAFDRRIRTRKDLSRVGIDDLAAVIQAQPTEESFVSANASIVSLVTRLGATSAQLVPVGPTGDQATLVRLAETFQSPATVTLQPAASLSATAAKNASSFGVTILAVRWGKDDRNAMVRVANELSSAGTKHISVLLYAVPSNEVSNVES